MNNLEESFSLFNIKCAKLNIPPEFVPDSHYLKKIFRQRLSLIDSFVNKVETVNSVDCIRKNILIQLKLSDNEISNKSNPKEFKDFVKYNQLLEKIKTLEETNSILKQQELQRLNTIKNNDLKNEKSRENLRLNKSKLDILQAKMFQVNEEIEKESMLEKKIISVTPKKFSSNDNMEEHSRNIKGSIEILKRFTAESAETGNISPSVRGRFWRDATEKVKNIPNVILFQTIMKQLNSILKDSVLSLTEKELKGPHSPKITEKLLPPLYELKIVTGIELLALRNKLTNSKSTCAEIIQSIENEMDVLINSSIDNSFQLEDDDIIGEFVSALIAKLNLEGKIRYCSNVITSLKQQVDSNNKHVREEYEQLVNDTKSFYILIGEKIENVQEYVAQIYEINDKINFSKISLMRMIQSLKMEMSQQHNRTLMNQTLNFTMVAVNKSNEISLPLHENELLEFLDIPIHAFDKSMVANKVLLLNDENFFSSFMFATKSFLYPNELFEHMEQQFKFADANKELTRDVESCISDLQDIDADVYEKQHDKNCEEISSMMDSISKYNMSIRSHLRNLNLIYDYGMKNPLRKFIPPNRKVLGKSYFEYEKDYMLYYNMIKK